MDMSLYNTELQIFMHPDDIEDELFVRRNVGIILKFGDRMKADFGVFPDILEFYGKVGCKFYDKMMSLNRFNFGDIKLSSRDYFDDKIVWKYSRKVRILREEGGIEHEKPLNSLVVPGWVTTPPVDYSMNFAYTTDKELQPEITISIIDPDNIINNFKV